MGLFSAAPRPPEQRAAWYAPMLQSTLVDDAFTVDASNTATSLQSIAVRSAADLVASLVSELPADVYRGKGRDKTEVSMPGYLEDPAGDGNGRQDWLYQVLMSWLLRGNGYGEALDWGRNGLFPTQVSWFYPDDCSGYLDGDGRVQWLVSGKEIPADRFVHRRVNPVPGRVLGLSPIAAHAASIGLSITSTRFGLQWFRDGAHPSGMLTNDEDELTPTTAREAKDRFVAALRGSREPIVLGKGWSFKEIQVAPEESQFLETQGWTEAQCARIFGPGIAEVLGYETGGSMDYSNVVDRRADVLVFSVDRWINRAERLLTWMLPRPQYVKLNRDALLQSTTLARYQAHAIALDKQFKTVNEVRDDEDLPPVTWGDKPLEPKPGAAPAKPTDGGDGNPA